MAWQNGPTDMREIEQGKRIITIGIKSTKNRSNRQPRAAEEGVLTVSTITTARSRAERGTMQIVSVH